MKTGIIGHYYRNAAEAVRKASDMSRTRKKKFVVCNMAGGYFVISEKQAKAAGLQY